LSQHNATNQLVCFLRATAIDEASVCLSVTLRYCVKTTQTISRNLHCGLAATVTLALKPVEFSQKFE